jgi:hypothetical protein
MYDDILGEVKKKLKTKTIICDVCGKPYTVYNKLAKKLKGRSCYWCRIKKGV